MQRLFATFPDGVPGAGLLLLRLAAGITLAYDAIASFGAETAGELILTFVACFAGLLLIAGLWTPVVGAVIALAEAVLAALLHIHSKDDPWSHGVLAALAVGLAMLGPGRWSIDARLFGRKLLTRGDKRRVR